MSSGHNYSYLTTWTDFANDMRNEYVIMWLHDAKSEMDRSQGVNLTKKNFILNIENYSDYIWLIYMVYDFWNAEVQTSLHA